MVGITIPKGIFCCCKFLWKLCLTDLLVYCDVFEVFKSFSFGKDCVCAESRHATAGMTTTAVSFLRVSKHLDGRAPWRKWSRRLSFRQRFQLPKKEELQVSVGKQRKIFLVSWSSSTVQLFFRRKGRSCSTPSLLQKVYVLFLKCSFSTISPQLMFGMLKVGIFNVQKIWCLKIPAFFGRIRTNYKIKTFVQLWQDF